MLKPSPRVIYERLLTHFGPQGWWPVTPPGCATPRYRPRYNRRPTSRECFEICVGAILTQNTAWTNVEKALGNLHRARACSARGIARMRTARLAALIRPSGYFNQKADRLKSFARYVVRAHGEDLNRLFAGPIDTVRHELLSLHGVGPETADSMALYAGGLPTFVIDAYTLRLGRRLGWFRGHTTYDQAKKALEQSLACSVHLFNEYHALIVALGKEYCRPAPRCAACPLKRLCGYDSKGIHGSTTTHA